MREPALPLPPYRYLPGRAPHPLRHPDGHRHFHPDPLPGPLWDPQRAPAADRRFRHGADLYDAGFWWEAHELWEAIWHAVPRDRPERTLLQGLIQGAACRVKLALGHEAPARRLRARVGEKLAAVRAARGPVVWETDLVAFERGLDRALAGPPGPPGG